MNILQLNIELCRALGIDTEKTTKVVLTVEAGKRPVVEVHRLATAADADKLQTAVTMLELRPVAVGGTVDPGKTDRVGE